MSVFVAESGRPSVASYLPSMKVLIPTPLRQYTGKQASVEIAANTIAETLSKLTGQYPDLRKQLFTDDGKLRQFVNVYVNDEDIRHLERENTAVKENDTISIVPSVAGGNVDNGVSVLVIRVERAFRPAFRDCYLHCFRR